MSNVLKTLAICSSSNKRDQFGSDSLLNLIEMKHVWHLFLCLKGHDVLWLLWAQGLDLGGGSSQQVEGQVSHRPQVGALFMPPTQVGLKS